MAARCGTLNAITDVPGLGVGCAHDPVAQTGVTVVRPTADAFAGTLGCAVDVRGGGPGTRETDALLVETLVDRVDAVVLSGGSVYGLAAADGVTTALGAKDEGFALIDQPGVPKSPVVPAAILYDLANGGDKTWGGEPPYRRLGVEALAATSQTVSLGRSGAGFGARAGDGLGGLGAASAVMTNGVTVGALVAVNSFGAVRMPGSQAFWAWPFEQMWREAPEFGGARPDLNRLLDLEDWGPAKLNPAARRNTTIAVVATDAALQAGDLKRVAIMAQSGLARAIRPVHAPFDGDVVFAVSTGAYRGEGQSEDPLVHHALVATLGEVAAGCLARAVARGVYEAERAPPDDN